MRNWVACCLLLPILGCVGEIRESTTARTSTEQLLLSTAAERAIEQSSLQSLDLVGRRVAIDDSHFVSYDKDYVVSAVRHHFSENGAILVGKDPVEVMKDGRKVMAGPERIVEIRNGALGIDDASWGIGLPPLPLPVPQTTLNLQTPSVYFFYRDKQEGWAKFQLWVYEPNTKEYLKQSGDLWGYSYYTKWWLLGMGPFDFSNDIYPSAEALERNAN